MDGIRMLAFDTGGTILDWHNGIVGALSERGARQGIAHDWHGFANEYRRRSLSRMTGTVDQKFNIDDVHRVDGHSRTEPHLCVAAPACPPM